jgi:hypothetical protein
MQNAPMGQHPPAQHSPAAQQPMFKGQVTLLMAVTAAQLETGEGAMNSADESPGLRSIAKSVGRSCILLMWVFCELKLG